MAVPVPETYLRDGSDTWRWIPAEETLEQTKVKILIDWELLFAANSGDHERDQQPRTRKDSDHDDLSLQCKAEAEASTLHSRAMPIVNSVVTHLIRREI